MPWKPVGQPVSSPREAAFQGMPTHSGGLPVMSSRGGLTPGMSTSSGGQPVVSSRGGITQGLSTRSGGKQLSAAERWAAADSDSGEDLLHDDVFKSGIKNPIEITGAWLTEEGGVEYQPLATDPPSPTSSVIAGQSKQIAGPTGAIPKRYATPEASTPSLGEEEQSWSSSSEPSSPSKNTKTSCKGCSWTGKSLRGHLVRTKSPCKELYNMQELEEEAKKIEKHQKAQYEERHKDARKLYKAKWEKGHQIERAERKRQQSPIKRPPSPSKAPSHKCPLCRKNFTTKQNCERHMSAVCLQYAPKFKCDVCEKLFQVEDKLKRHILEVHGEEKYKCDVCPAAYSRLYDLRKHERDHIKSGSSQAQASNTPQVSPPNKKPNPQRAVIPPINASNIEHSTSGTAPCASIQCDICDVKFTVPQSLSRHIREVHKVDRLFHCPECPEIFSRHESLRRHLDRGKHSITLGCRYCKQDLVFKSHSAFRDHYVVRYGKVKNTCVNAEKMRKEDPSFDKWKCSICNMKVPVGGSHYIRVDPEEPSKSTCLTMLKKRKFITCPGCGERLHPSPSEWKKHYDTRDSSLTDCNTRLAWREEGDFVRGWQPLLIKGILVPSRTAHMPLDHPCHKKYPLNPSLPLPCWTPRVINSLLGNPLNFKPAAKKSV